MADLLTATGLEALTATVERYGVYARERQRGARWRCLGTFPTDRAAWKHALNVMHEYPRTDWSVRRESGPVTS